MTNSTQTINYLESKIYESLAINNDCQENIQKSLIGEFKFEKRLEELEKEFIESSQELMRKYCQANCQVFPENMSFIIQPNETQQYDTDELINKGLIKGTLKQRLTYRIRKVWYKLLFILFLLKIYIIKKWDFLLNLLNLKNQNQK
jgi:hypothetical protein